MQKAARCALFAVLDLAADPGRPQSAAEIAGRHGLSVNHMAKVLPQLARAGMVRAVRGAAGGYRIKAESSTTTLWDIVRVFEPIEPDISHPAASATTLALDEVQSGIQSARRRALSALTIADMLQRLRLK